MIKILDGEVGILLKLGIEGRCLGGWCVVRLGRDIFGFFFQFTGKFQFVEFLQEIKLSLVNHFV